MFFHIFIISLFFLLVYPLCGVALIEQAKKGNRVGINQTLRMLSLEAKSVAVQNTVATGMLAENLVKGAADETINSVMGLTTEAVYHMISILTLTNCINWLRATGKLLNISLLDSNGKLEQQAVEAIATGEEYIAKMNDIL